MEQQLQQQMNSNALYYFGWDAHAYTHLLREHPQLHSFRQQPHNGPIVTLSDAQTLVDTISRTLKDHERTNVSAECVTAIAPVLAKMVSRWDASQGGYYDADIGHVNIFALLNAVWSRVLEITDREKDASLFALFVETLTDASMTCIQGDSHRLALLYIALTQEQGDTNPIPVATASFQVTAQ